MTDSANPTTTTTDEACSCCSTTDGDAVATPATGTTTSVYAVAGMTCGHCVNSVSAEIAKVDGVAGVDVDLTTGVVTVTSNAPLAAADVAAAVADAGYELVAADNATAGTG